MIVAALSVKKPSKGWPGAAECADYGLCAPTYLMGLLMTDLFALLLLLAVPTMVLLLARYFNRRWDREAESAVSTRTSPTIDIRSDTILH